ncbi:MAG: hypothetical protein WCK80_00415 [bacterium]
MKKQGITAQINQTALRLLDKQPEGIWWTDLNAMIQETNKNLHPKTINGCVWRLIEKYPDQVYKPEKGLFKLNKYS